MPRDSQLSLELFTSVKEPASKFRPAHGLCICPTCMEYLRSEFALQENLESVFKLGVLYGMVFKARALDSWREAKELNLRRTTCLEARAPQKNVS